MTRPRFRRSVRPVAVLVTALLTAASCSKKDSRPTPPPPASPPGEPDLEKREPGSPAPGSPAAAGPASPSTRSDRRTENGNASDAPPPSVLPSESAAGGAALWITAPDLSRTINRVVALLERHREAGGELLADLPEGSDLRATAEQLLRGGLFSEVLGLGDPAAIDLAQPVRVRLSFPATGSPMAVVSLGATRPLAPTRAGKLVGVPSPDGRYLVGIGVEPDVEAPWPADPSFPAEQDLVASVALDSALPAVIKALSDLQNLASNMGGSEPMPSWLAEMGAGLTRFFAEVSGIDSLAIGLRVGAAPEDAPLRLSLALDPTADGAMATALPLLALDAPPFGLLETIDAGGDAWMAGRMSPVGMKAILEAIVAPTEQFLVQVLPDDWRTPLLDAFHAAVEISAGGDGRMVAAMRTLPDGRGAFSMVWGVAEGQADAVRAASRTLGAALAVVLVRLSEKFSFGANVTWTQAVARAGGSDVDRLTIVVPRGALGPVAAMLQPGQGDLRWDISVAVGPALAVWTSDPDPAVIQRALASRARGGGAAAGTPPADRLASADPDLLELGWMDLAAGFRDNPALACPPGTTFPRLPMHLEVRFAAGRFEAAIDFLPGAAADIFPFLQAAADCLPTPPTEP